MKTKKIYPFIHVGDYVSGKEIMFDAREVAYYLPVDEVDEEDNPLGYVVGLKSGKELLLSADVDAEIYPGENLVTIIDTVLYSHFWHDNEDSTPVEN